jgi:(p)ppGpp synthase/HD superfamily hydrolase
MRRYAQTNLELYAQLRAEGYDQTAQESVARGYMLAAQLFAGLHRASGKVFVAHTVGTASVLVEARARLPIVLAGLIHAAYTHGEFGDGWRGVTAAKRAHLRTVVGDDAEDLVDRYSRFRWRADALAGLKTALPGLDGANRDVVLMRLANELDDHLDLGVLYYEDAERRRDLLEPLALCVEIARDLGNDRLADALSETFAECRAAPVPPTMRIPGARGSFLLPPASHRPTIRIRLARWRDKVVGLD